MEYLKGYTNEENALRVEGYPYGRKRTSIRYWVESVVKKGDRFVSQTLNPKTQKWNKPKKSTYFAVLVMTKEDNGYIKYKGLYPSTSEEDYKTFIEGLEDFEFNELQLKQLKCIRSIIKTYSNVTYKIRSKQFKNKVTGEIVEQVPLMEMSNYEEVTEEEQEEREKKTQENINKLVGLNYSKDNGSL